MTANVLRIVYAFRSPARNMTDKWNVRDATAKKSKQLARKGYITSHQISTFAARLSMTRTYHGGR